MHESRTALEASLATRWELSGVWTASGARMVTRARDVENGDEVRVSAVSCAADGMATAQMAREIGALECLAHQPTVVPLLASGRADGWLYIVTPWGEPSLRALVIRDGPRAVADAVQHAIAVADLLHFAHSLGLAHGAVSAEALSLDAGQIQLGGFSTVTRAHVDSERARTAARDVLGLAGALFEALTATQWRVGLRCPDHLPEALIHLLHRALGRDRSARFATAITFAQALCAVRDTALSDDMEVGAREAALEGEIAERPLSDGAARSLRVLHALLDRAEVADLPPEPDDPLVVHCWRRASAQVGARDARLVALQCRWRLLAERDPVGAYRASQAAPNARAVLPYRARALAVLGRAAEARTLAVRSWFDDVALDLSGLRSLISALLLTRAFEMASLVCVAECAHGVDDPVIVAAGQSAVARGAVRRLTPSAQTRTLRAIASAIERRVPWTAELLVDPRWDILRDDHRFAVLLARSKASWTT
ncbi:MAG: hypothetical protein H7099_05695 [Gemmatimonadaceae bacterium]|nr:hypothetical protein [Gemmatimonadaceae bacterium]